MPVAVGAAALVGLLAAIQARINGILGVRLDDGVAAGLISFVVGTLVVSVVVALQRTARRGLRRFARELRSGGIPFWMLLGGACGAVMVATQGLTAGIVGVALFTVGTVAGQTVHALVLDRIGFGPGGRIAVTPGRVIGGVLALAAVGISVSGDVLASTPLWMLVLPLLAGAGIAWQQGANGRLGRRVESSWTATLISFAVGTVVLIAATLISGAVRGAPELPPAEPYLYVGGAIGVVCVFLNVILVARIGVLLLGLATVLGQLMTAVAIDLIWPAEGAPGAGQIILMVLVAAAAVAAAAIRFSPSRGRRAAASASRSRRGR